MSIKRRAARYLVAAAVSAAISFLSLPAITALVGPSAFGAVALVSAFVSLGTAFATLGSSFVLYRFVPTAAEGERPAIVFALCAYAAGVVVVWAAVATMAFLALRHSVDAFATIPPTGYALSVAVMLLSPYWPIAADVLILEERAGFFAAAVIAQAVVGAGATIVCLYVFRLGLLSLFVGNLAGSMPLFVGALIVLWRDVGARPDRKWLGEVGRIALHNLPSQAAESGVTFVERMLLSRYAGLHALGLYAHSQRYREVAQLGVKAVARGAWPVGLAEARDEGTDFAATARVWSGLHLAIALVGLGMITVGDRVIALMTHDKFTGAYVYAGMWFMYVLVQNSARPQLAALFALGEGKIVARVNLIANLGGLAALALLVPSMGLSGGVIAGLAQITISRVGWAVASRRYRATPFQDGWVLFGLAIMGAALAVKLSLEPGLAGSLGLLVVAGSVCLVTGWKVVVVLARTMWPRPGRTMRG